MAMNAALSGRWPAWTGARQARLKRRQHGFAMYEAERRPGLPAPVANAYARFEQEARNAMREWLLL
jgi:hypothetical protein